MRRLFLAFCLLLASLVQGGAPAPAGPLPFASPMLIQASASASPTASPHRYWRLVMTGDSNPGGGGSVEGFSEMEMRTSVGGADVTGSGTASASSSFSGFTAAGAFANDGATTEWASNGTLVSWLKYDFGAGNDQAIVEIAISARTSTNVYQAPGPFKVQSSDDNTNWNDEWWIRYPGGANGHGYVSGTLKVFTKPVTDQAPSASRYRYFRLSITGANGGAYVGAREIYLRTFSDSAEETAFASGTATSRSNFSGLPPSSAFDLTTAEWASNNFGFPEWVQYDFGSGRPVMVQWVGYQARSGVESTQSPTGIDFQVSNNGTSWTTVKSVTPASWTSFPFQAWSIP
jgi:hypothetical protein